MGKMKAAKILKEIHPERVRYTAAKGIFKEGAKNRYEKNLQRWYLDNSTEIKIDGVLIGEDEFFDSSTAKTIETNKIDLNGILLNESTFIDKELNQGRAIIEKTLGSDLNRDTYEETKTYIDYLESRKNDICNNHTRTTIKGFSTSLSEPQQKELFKALSGNYIECSEAEFLAMFSDTPKPIKWIDTSTTHPTKPNKQTIFEFIYLLSEFQHIVLPDLEKGNKANLFRVLEFLFPEVENFANSSGSGKSQQNTQRQKELRRAIEKLSLID
nr:hypothetical protein [uncultured Carboxylicivirga sp.]